MREQRAEVEAIAADEAPPSFDNTLAALERSGALLRRVLPVFENASSADTDEAIDALEAELAPAARGTPRRDPTGSAPVRANRRAARAARRVGPRPRPGVPARPRAPAGRCSRAPPSSRRPRAPHAAERTAVGAHHRVPAAPARGHQRPRPAPHRGAGAGRARCGRALGRSRGRRVPRARRVAHHPRAPHRAAGARLPRRSRRARPAARRVTGPRMPRRRARHPRHAARDRAPARRARPPPRLRASRRRGHRRRDRGLAPTPSPPSCANSCPATTRNVARERAELVARASGERREGAGRGRLGVPRRAGPRRTARPRPVVDPPVLRARPRARRRRLPRGHPALRPALRRTARPGRLPPRHSRVRGVRRGRLTGRPVPLRPVHSRLEARRRVDELARRAVRTGAATCRSW